MLTSQPRKLAPTRRSKKSRRDVFELEAIWVCSSISDVLMPAPYQPPTVVSSRCFPWPSVVHRRSQAGWRLSHFAVREQPSVFGRKLRRRKRTRAFDVHFFKFLARTNVNNFNRFVGFNQRYKLEGMNCFHVGPSIATNLGTVQRISC